MKGNTVVLGHLNGREVAALMVDGQLDDLFVEGAAHAPGTIYRARADRPMKGQGGMFLTTPDGPAFLRQVKGLAPGALLLVQVSGYAEPGKAIPVTTKLLFKSRYAIVTPDAPGLNISRSIRDEDERDRLLEIAHGVAGDQAAGLILRSACDGADAEAIEDDISAMLTLAAQVTQDDGTEVELLAEGDGPHALAWRDWSMPAEVMEGDAALEDSGALDGIDAARSASVALSGGGHMYVESTRALVAVDVNTGGDTSPAAGLRANLACARALPRALRLRGLGGQIVVDFAPMPKKDRRTVESALRGAFRADPEETTLVGWTALGHYELQRKRGRVALSEVPAEALT